MQVLRAVFFKEWKPERLKPFSNTVSTAAFRSLDFLILSIRYPLTFFASSLKKIRIFPGALKKVKVNSFNLGRLFLFPKALHTVLFPLSKNNFIDLGKDAGLRLTHDISYQPASGLCLGMSLFFLSRYFDNKSASDEKKSIKAAKCLRWGGNETSMKLQALYDALLGMNGSADQSAKKNISNLIRGKEYFIPKGFENIFEALRKFINNKNDGCLRKHLLGELEVQGLRISPHQYTLILEADALWNIQKKGGTGADSIHHAVISTIAKLVQIQTVSVKRLEGRVDQIGKQLAGLKRGHYLIQTRNHTIAALKNEKKTILFDCCEGLAFIKQKESEEAYMRLIKFYEDNPIASLNIIHLNPVNNNE